jgi:hypothetical protein
VLTDRGLERLRGASQTHLRGINEHFLTVVDAGDLENLERTMTAVARQAGPGESDPGVCATDVLSPQDQTLAR